MNIDFYILSQRPLIRAYCGDCLNLLHETKDNQYDLSIVDPPYGIGQPKQGNLEGYNGREALEVRLQKNRLNSGASKLKDRVLNTSNCEWDNAVPEQEYFDLLMSKSVNQIIWGGNYFNLPPTRGIICWDKVQPWENFSQIEYAWTSFDCPAKLFRFDNRISGKIHPTQKPVKLYLWLLQNYAKEGQRILDTHGGSFSSAIACYKKGFDLDICEMDSEYFRAGIDRFKHETSQYIVF